MDAPGYAYLQQACDESVAFYDLHLQAETGSTVRVIADGLPVSGAEIEAWLGDRRIEVMGTTDDKGELSLFVATPIVVTAAKGEDRSRAVLLRPGQQCVMELAAKKRFYTIRFENAATGEGFGGLGFAVKALNAVATELGVYSTDADGLARMPSFGTIIEIVLTDHSVDLMEAVDEFGLIDAHIYASQHKVIIDFASILGEVVTLRGGAAKDRKMRLVCEGVPITEACFQSAWLLDAGDSRWRTVGEARRVAKGTGVYSLAALSLDRYGTSGQPHLAISAPGYQTVYLEDPVTTIRVGDIRTVEMQPSTPRSVQLVGSVAVLAEVAVVRCLSTGVDVWEGRVQDSGIVGPFPWPGGNVELSLPEACIAAEVPARDLRGPSAARVELDASASIEVRTQNRRLLCVNEGGCAIPGRIAASGRVVFDSLLPGEYRVVTTEELSISQLVKRHGSRDSWIRLGPGQTVVIARDPNGAVPSSVSGWVAVEGFDPATLFVCAIYEGEGIPIQGGGHSRTPVGEDGYWEFAGLSEKPVEYLVGTNDFRGKEVTLGRCGPGETVRIPTARLSIDLAKDCGAGMFTARYQPQVEGRRILAEFVHVGFIQPGVEARLFIPRTVDSVRLSFGGKEDRIAMGGADARRAVLECE